MMVNEKITDITVEILKNIRDEIKGLREDTNDRFKQIDKRFEQMDKRFERMEEDIGQIRKNISHIVSRFDNDFILLANEVNNIKGRLQVCEQHLGIQN